MFILFSFVQNNSDRVILVEHNLVSLEKALKKKRAVSKALWFEKNHLVELFIKVSVTCPGLFEPMLKQLSNAENLTKKMTNFCVLVLQKCYDPCFFFRGVLQKIESN